MIYLTDSPWKKGHSEIQTLVSDRPQKMQQVESCCALKDSNWPKVYKVNTVQSNTAVSIALFLAEETLQNCLAYCYFKAAVTNKLNKLIVQ